MCATAYLKFCDGLVDELMQLLRKGVLQVDAGDAHRQHRLSPPHQSLARLTHEQRHKEKGLHEAVNGRGECGVGV